MFLTIGMATYDDFDGVYFTVQSLLVHHREDLVDCEIVVVDNAPRLPVAKTVRNYCQSVSGPVCPVRYVPLPSPVGTSPARDEIFRVAQGEYVLVVDCHVLLYPGALRYLRDYLLTHHPADDLLQGVLLSDSGQHYWTHFADVWRAEMWGIWGTDPRGKDPNGEPFDIFAQGLGLFCARRKTWLGFHPLARGFGGEECYIHLKYRQAGRRTLCLPGLRWVHRFGRPRGVPYPLTQWNKVRNYVLELKELGLPLDRLYRHFVEGLGDDPGDGSEPQGPINKMPKDLWDYLIEDPENRLQPPAQARPSGGCGGCGGRLPADASLESLAKEALESPNELQPHLRYLQPFVKEAHVLEVTARPLLSTVGFLAARPKKLVSLYDRSAPPPELERLVPEKQIWHKVFETEQIPEGPWDLLFLDPQDHDADTIWRYLSTIGKQATVIAIHDTEIFGEIYHNRPGILPAVRRFVRENPEYVVLKHSRESYGLTVLSRRPEDRKPLPSLAKQVFNFTKAVIKHVREGARFVSQEELEKRLDICALCEHRVENRCSICGCYLIDSPTGQGGKAEWADQSCPLGKWLSVPQTGEGKR